MARLQTEPLSIEDAAAAVRSDADGAVALFVGTVRDRNAGRRVRYLEYEAYDAMAMRQLARLERETVARFPGIRAVDIRHRTGRVDIGQPSVIVAVAAEHRAAALSACSHVIDELKRTVPIWKKEHFEGGACWIEGPPGGP